MSTSRPVDADLVNTLYTALWALDLRLYRPAPGPSGPVASCRRWNPHEQRRVRDPGGRRSSTTATRRGCTSSATRRSCARRMSGFSNFAVSFTIISILSGCLTLYGFGMNTGGPAVIIWGWPSSG